MQGASDTDGPLQTMLHASCVAVQGRAALIIGASGRGKSGLALQLMAYGADLVSDDRTEVVLHASRLVARAPKHIRGMIEARGVGILNAKPVDAADVRLVVDLDRKENDRLPHPREIVLLGQSVPLLWHAEGTHFAPAILQFLRHGRTA
ncbi:HPr kinase/phosphorylase [Shimia sp. W99]